MDHSRRYIEARVAGIHITWPPTGMPEADAVAGLLAPWGLDDLAPHLEALYCDDSGQQVLQISLSPTAFEAWTPGFDTLATGRILRLKGGSGGAPVRADTYREILVALLASPVPVCFPSAQEFASALRIKANTVDAARKTMLTFDTAAAERPEQWWAYDEDYGFVIREGVSLITALIQATQPEVSGAMYGFSCYRASEYVMLLGLAQELEQRNPALYEALETLWRRRPIKSGEFHDVFLREQGSMEDPIPPRYFVPGDRTWFRNPDGVSAEASGFEGSWVIYMGNGQFSNFWKNDEPYTLEDKCLEIFHWRHGLYLDGEGLERINEARVAERVQASRNNPREMKKVLNQMQRYREARGIYTSAGGCMDTTREFARWVCPGTTDLVIPHV